MEAGVNNPSRYASKWAFIYIAVAALTTCIVQVLNIDPTSVIKILGYTVPIIAFLILAQLEYRRSLGGYVSFQQAFSLGVRYSVYTGLLFGVLIFVNLSFFSHEIEQSIAVARKTLAAQGFSKEQIEARLEVGKKHGASIGAFSAAIQTTILGIIISAIGALIVKKKVVK